jgi:DNA-binding CsgD family transcriptional regulator
MRRARPGRRAGWPTEEEMTFFTGPTLDSHPLIRWYRETGDLTPMSLTRVPRPILTKESIALVREHLTPVELDQQLTIPYRASRRHRVFVLSKTKRDFSDTDLVLARRIQPLVALVARQHDVLAANAPNGHDLGGVGAARVAATFGLTARETAVLKLLAEGLTATAIGSRLAISTRTVHVHLEHVYRKLGVRDRLMAVRVAGECGLWTPPRKREESVEAAAVMAQSVHPRSPVPRDVVGQRVAAWVPGTGVVRAGAPY